MTTAAPPRPRPSRARSAGGGARRVSSSAPRVPSAARRPITTPRRPLREPSAIAAPKPTKRLWAMLTVMSLAFAAVVVRLAMVQGHASNEFVSLGQQQLVHDITLPADRGTVFDRNGRDLALTINVSTVWADPREVTDPLGAAEALSPVLGIDVPTLQDRLSKNAGFVYLARKVDDDVAAKVKDLKIPGVQLMDEPKRFLPAGDLAVPVIGRVGLDNEGLGGIE